MKVHRVLGLCTVLLSSAALADLTCKNFTPHNWTSTLTRLYMYDNDPNGGRFTSPALPGFLLNTNPMTIAPHKGSTKNGSTFHMRVCESKSLGFNSTNDLWCWPPDSDPGEGGCGADGGCTRQLTSNIQIINTETRDCLTWQQQAPLPKSNLALYKFLPCDSNPNDTSQIFQASRVYTYFANTSDYYSPGTVCDWGPTFPVEPKIPIPYNDQGLFQAWNISLKDNKTIISRRGPYPNEWYVLAEAANPLTTYQGKKGN